MPKLPCLSADRNAKCKLTLRCHPEPFAICHPEQSEGSRFLSQGWLREGSKSLDSSASPQNDILHFSPCTLQFSMMFGGSFRSAKQLPAATDWRVIPRLLASYLMTAKVFMTYLLSYLIATNMLILYNLITPVKLYNI